MAEQTFEIVDGVRRAKSYELLDKSTIPAEVMDEEGNTIDLCNVSVESLRVTTKQSIDVSTQKEWERFMKTFNQVKAGLPIEPILVTPGTHGKMIRDVQLDPTGENQ